VAAAGELVLVTAVEWEFDLAVAQLEKSS